ncbi:response regulator transcription factor [Clostridium minihomine]|uniref:response regulator transcription factor n=1 Tax=Clostridium minihomine TaxID=2045012 RepID=UPI000C76A07E|nr:response regulator transcription factor [Clostridium minihomine]
MFKILVVEDDINAGKLMEAILTEQHFVPILAKNAQEALSILDQEHIDLMITDIMMPGMDGYSLTEQLRDTGYDFPILMVTAKDTIKDKRKGFIVGTDDYLVKPVDEEELILRVKALLRRAKIVSERKITIGNVTLNYDSLTVSRGTERVTLPQKEFMLLYKLLSYPNTIFTRLQLMDEIWGYDSQTGEHTVSVHIGRLRERFGAWPEFDIITVRGLGYKAVKNDEQ